MKKKILILLAATLALTCALTACKPADDATPDSEDEVVSEPEVPANPWSELLTEHGFISNEAAYGMTRSQWHEKFGDPELTQTSYYEDYTAEIYYAMLDDYAWCVELDYAITPEINTDGVDIATDPTPDLIRLGFIDRMTLFTGIDGRAANAYDLTNAYKGKNVSELANLNASLGEPSSKDETKWGYVAWELGSGVVTAMLDANSNVVYFNYETAQPEDADMDSSFLFDGDGSDGTVYGVLDGADADTIPEPTLPSDGDAEPVLPPDDSVTIISGDSGDTTVSVVG